MKCFTMAWSLWTLRVWLKVKKSAARLLLFTRRGACCAASSPWRRSTRNGAHHEHGTPQHQVVHGNPSYHNAATSSTPLPSSRERAASTAIRKNLSKVKLQVLVKSSKCMTLRFVDSMNIFPTSLASLIEDCKAARGAASSLYCCPEVQEVLLTVKEGQHVVYRYGPSEFLKVELN